MVMGEEHIEFDGFTPQALMLLAENRFHNSKAFYEEHKQALNELAIRPMRQIAQAMAPQMMALDPLMNLNPVRMVSRIRRDTRFTKDKSLYRANVWTVFSRPKASFPHAPCFWFEVTQEAYSYGLGYYDTTPALMQAFRKQMAYQPRLFERECRELRNAGFSFEGERYKRDKEGPIPERLKPYYNLKDIVVIRRGTDFGVLQSEAILGELRDGYHRLEGMYRFLMDAQARVEQAD